MRNLTGIPTILAESDEIVVTGGLGLRWHDEWEECKETRAHNGPEKFTISTHHDCDDHDVVIVWPLAWYTELCNCGPMSIPHPTNPQCPPERRIR